MDHHSQSEEYETIPWSQLAPQQPPLSTRIGMVAAAVVAIAAVAFVGARLLLGESTGVTVTIPGSSAEGTLPVAPPPSATAAPAIESPIVAAAREGAGSGPAAGEAAAEGARIYTEADLMAVIPEEDQRAAVARAEWFVTDYFTVDGDPQTAAAIREALPTGLEVTLPHEGGGGVSYVEWSRALRVVPDGPGRYRVIVAYRTLAGPAGEPLVRMPVAAVAVTVVLDGESDTAVADLPEPVVLESAPQEAASLQESEPPPEVVGAALDLVPGDGPVVESAALDVGGWRLVISVAGPSGLRWPLVIRP
jgi:hypothetical protein